MKSYEKCLRADMSGDVWYVGCITFLSFVTLIAHLLIHSGVLDSLDPNKFSIAWLLTTKIFILRCIQSIDSINWEHKSLMAKSQASTSASSSIVVNSASCNHRANLKARKKQTRAAKNL